MESDGLVNTNIFNECESQSSLNGLILDYYKKFGRKRDLEQFFSLSTANSEIKDPASSFWKKMKSQTDSDSGEKKSESSTELCRISIKCSLPGPANESSNRTKSDSESPPIISEEGQCLSRNSDNESEKSDDMQSHKSIDNTLDTSLNKPHSPTSSITSQRKLEWDSLADVGYANESDRKNSASSLSTLERMALHQQYSNNDTKQNMNIGPPTAQSTPLDTDDNKNRKGNIKKTTKIYKKDVDLVEFNVSNNENLPQPINVNLTKHISFNVEKNGGITVENVTKSVSVSPEKPSIQTETVKLQEKIDREIQTTLNKDAENSSNPIDKNFKKQYPVFISLNTLRKRKRKKKVKKIQRKHTKRRDNDKENVPLEKSVDQVSEAESFEYMPGHMYNLNKIKTNTNEEARKSNVKNNKSSGDSSTGLTTDSSKAAKCSFTKDLEKGIDILKSALNKGSEEETLKRKLVKEVVQRLIKSKYKDDESSTEFLSGLSFDSRKIDVCHSYHTTSTSDTNTARNIKEYKPKKSILRMDKFNSNAIASTSQSVPNLATVTQNDNSISTYAKKLCDLSNTDSDLSNKTKNRYDTVADKISSEELYKKYLEALQREKAYKKHLKDKELFLKHKLVSSDVAFNVSKDAEMKAQRVKDLMTDLTQNNYDAGSGDACRFEGSQSNPYLEKYNSIRKQQTHSVFTLSSGNSDNNKRNFFSNKQNEAHAKSCYKKGDEHYCCCPFHKSHAKIAVVDSSIQVNMTPKGRSSPEVIPNSSCNANQQEIVNNSPADCKLNQSKCQTASDCTTKDIKYVCLCADNTQEVPENILIYKCSRLTNKCSKTSESKAANSGSRQTSSNSTSPRRKSSFKIEDCDKKCLVIKDNPNQMSQSSQTNLNLPIRLQSRSSGHSVKSTSTEGICSNNSHDKKPDVLLIQEATRCIQTEISIDPKISDPSISDINIINDQNCVQLISEQYKKISSPNSDSNVPKEYIEHHRIQKLNLKNSSDESHKTDKDKALALGCTVANSGEYTNTIEKEDKGVQMNPNDFNEQISNNFTIPIQGTNMTLKVSLGSEANANPKTSINKIQSSVAHTSKGTETIKNNVVEKFTSLREECSKCIQSSETNIFDEFYKKRKTDQFEDQNRNFVEQTNKTCCVNTCATKDYKYNTYPKNDRNLIQKPLLRCNTDTDKIASHVTFNRNFPRQVDFQPENTSNCRKQSTATPIDSCAKQRSSSSEKSQKSAENSIRNKSGSTSETDNSKTLTKDPILDIIQDITRRYSKKEFEKNKRKKCFKEIITVLNYLLDTEESTDDKNKESSSSSSENEIVGNGCNRCGPRKSLVDKGVQLSTKKSKSLKIGTESSDIPISTDMPSTSTDSGTCKILKKIKKECEKYHQRRCKLHSEEKICETSSSTSVNCHQCRRVHHCSCKSSKCKNHKKNFEKPKKKCVAYNLIIQTSDSVVSDKVNYGFNRPQLKNIVVKVPPKRKVEHMQFGEISSKIENNLPQFSPRSNIYGCRGFRNESEISSTDDVIKKAQTCTVRDYLEKNRPDFVEKSSNRQQCLKAINETRANERATKRQLLSMQLDRQQELSALTLEELNRLERELGKDLRRKKVAPKFISEREMKTHSEKIYKSLPEVVQKKEKSKKENIKKTNLLMANIFKKNLQKKTLQGAVNLSNYSTVIKI